MRLLLITLITTFGLTIASCNTNPTRSETIVTVTNSASDKTRKVDTIQSLPQNPKENKDTLLVYKRAAVLYSPSSIRIAKLKKEMGEQDFYTAADDNVYYMSTAHEFLDSMKMPVLNADRKLFIKFIISEKVQQVVRLDTIAAPWGIFFYDPKKQPLSIEILQIDEEYKSYFQ